MKLVLRNALAGMFLILWLSHLASSQPAAAGATDLTVRLFSTGSISHLQVEPHGASERTCPRCASKPIEVRLDVTWDARAPRRLRVNGRDAPSLQLEGAVDVTANNGQRARAAGRWRIQPAADGLHVTVLIPSERYVMAVLTAEAQQQTSAEALKALAVVARSFALLGSSRHGNEGLCDSTHCQAMRLANVSTAVEAAVQATAGETLWKGSKRVEGYFSQHCGGTTQDAAAAWGGSRQSWLISQPDPYCQRVPSQWHTEISEADVRSALAKEGWPMKASIVNIEPAGRDASGRAHTLVLRGPGQTLTLPASSFRFAVNRALGWNQLRSDRYTVHRSGAKLIFDGTGYGHGVGLCQAGASEMARQGSSHRQILGFYFPGTQVRIGASDEGWKDTRTAHVLIREVNPSATFAAAAEQAYTEAKQRWPGQTEVHPRLAIYPSTELFRQITGEPGWMLAAARGENISMQPLAVLNRNGGAADVLRHELLHTLVEADTAAGTPLWLREGLVEVLSGEHCPAAASANVTLPAPAVDHALRTAASQLENQRAHAAACSLVRGSVQAHGLEAVRSWIGKGVPPNVVPGK